MKLDASDCCVLNGGPGSWAFEPLAQQLSTALGVAISAKPKRFNYLLNLEPVSDDFSSELFVPLSSIRIASDKRLTAESFKRHNVPTPQTVLLATFAELTQYISHHRQSEWCLKFPIGCGGGGHRMVTIDSSAPPNWPTPYILQEFIRLERPEVYRLYCAGGDLFGWVARRFPVGRQPSPWVAHARGARYVRLGRPPQDACEVGRAALEATGLCDTFGCVDLLCRPSGEWVVLEVGTDGLFNHVDRELDDPELEAELLRRITATFWNRATIKQ
jgi:hypothetical protein